MDANAAPLPVPNTENAVEFALLAGLLAFPETRTQVCRLIGAGDFSSAVYGSLAAVLFDLDDYDPTVVLAACRSRAPEVIKLLTQLVGRATVAEHVVLHAQTLRDQARRRRLWESATRAAQKAEAANIPTEDTLVELMGVVEEMIDTADTEDEPPMNVADFLAGSDVYDWIVPGLLARSDRVMLTGNEGGGKSELTRQVAVCVAAGVHPFRLTDEQPRNVLIVDLENSRELLRMRLRVLTGLADRRGRPVDPGRLRLISRPSGVDLGDTSDVAWLARQVELAHPDLIVAGPLYRMHTAALDKEEAARQITVALDSICNRSRAALILEAHAGHGVGGQRWWRPTGSSLFMRWAQFGLGMRTRKGATEVTSWRGARDIREWPEALRRGGDGSWPWLESQPFGEQEAS